ncbi:mce related protein [Thalassoglobus neptunius]|uniref:Mce related protein n=1 Tax=Thalassoglobus neptunius TaxID=1938619 RepID=A0A5C5X4N2_9PLAN|nr:MlaD family protein [Thalassoglobus neptunius]TWT57539.1 mce related protein [Thalassoglobus neptunius]
MSERQLQFRVGLFVLASMVIGAVLILQFGDIKDYWKKTYPLAIHFDDAPGLYPGSPVKQNGLGIGTVRSIVLDEAEGGVLVVVDIVEDHVIRIDAEASLVQSLLGDAKIEFSSGRAGETIPPNSRIDGIAPADPMQIVQRMESTVNESLVSFTDTSQEWQKVAVNLNNLMETREGDLDTVIERTALALDSFTRTMNSATKTFDEVGTTLTQAGSTLETATAAISNANSFIADPQLQADLRRTAAALPVIAEETRLTISTARDSIVRLSKNMDEIHSATAPLAEQSDLIVNKLSGSLIQLESLLTEMNQFAQLMNDENGSVKRLASDPELYQNLNRSAASLSVLLENLNPILNDMRVFSDKVARHPEILGIRGAVKGSSGLKDSAEIEQTGGFFRK